MTPADIRAYGDRCPMQTHRDLLRALADVVETAQHECSRQGCHCLEGNEHLHECSFCQIGQTLARVEALKT